MKLRNYEIDLSMVPDQDCLFENERIKNIVLNHFRDFFKEDKDRVIIKDETKNGIAEISFDGNNKFIKNKKYFPMAMYVCAEDKEINLTDALYSICEKYIKSSDKKIKKKAKSMGGSLYLKDERNPYKGEVSAKLTDEV